MIQKKITLIACIVLSTITNGQNMVSDSINIGKMEEKNIELTIMPYINYNRNLDLLIGAIPMIMYKTNKQTNKTLSLQNH